MSRKQNILDDCFSVVKSEFVFTPLTGGLISSEDALAGSNNLVSNVTELLLLLRSEEGVCVRHPDSGWEERE